MNLKDLQRVIPEQWKIQSKAKDGKSATLVAYIDARDVMKLLDEVVGPEGWKDEYIVLTTNDVKCCLSIKVGDEWIGKEDIGTQSDYEAEKGAFSDAFKRAAVKWGVGRFLYDLEMQKVALDQYGGPIDGNGHRIWNLTEYVHSLKNKPKQQEEPKYEPVETKPAHVTDIACEKCGSAMKEKKGPRGPFLGCSNYPTCKNTKSL